MFFIKIAKYHLYLFQLENYELGRFWKLVFKKGLLPPSQPLRKSLVWTNKAILIFAVSEILIFALSGLIARFLHLSVLENWVATAVAFFGLLAIFKHFSFVFFSLAAILITPADFGFKKWIVLRARAKIQDRPNLKIIAVAGSYGKTTMKEFIKAVLAPKYQVLSTPESINTPVGISRWVLSKLDDTVEVLIIEMGEHYFGDVAELCRITPPDIAVVTGVNEAHLERMGKMDMVVSTIFEIVSGLKPKGLTVLNADDSNVIENYKKFIWPDHKIETYQVSSIKYQVFDPNALCWSLKLDEIGDVKLYMLGEYALGDVDCAVKIGKLLGLNNLEIKRGIESIRPVEHRLQPFRAPGDILVIDDAYNGNSAGVKEAIRVLGRFIERRKIFLTPGLVETGNLAKQVHLEIGRQLASAADVVILVRNSVSGWIDEGIREKLPTTHYPLPTILWFNTALEAHANLKNILKSGDVILFQNDWGDQYL